MFFHFHRNLVGWYFVYFQMRSAEEPSRLLVQSSSIRLGPAAGCPEVLQRSQVIKEKKGCSKQEFAGIMNKWTI